MTKPYIFFSDDDAAFALAEGIKTTTEILERPWWAPAGQAQLKADRADAVAKIKSAIKYLAES